jgi:tetratricopeptide (TPR) repeat protein
MFLIIEILNHRYLAQKWINCLHVYVVIDYICADLIITLVLVNSLLISAQYISEFMSKKDYFFLLFMFFITLSLPSDAQRMSTEDSTRYNFELDEARKGVFNDPVSTKKYLDSIQPIVKNNIDLFLKWNNAYGIYYGVKGIVDSAVFNFKFIIDRSANQPDRKAAAVHNLGLTVKSAKKYEEAKRLFNQALGLYDQTRDSVGLARVSGSMASLYKDLEMYDLTVRWILHSISLLEKVSSDQTELINSEKQKLANLYLVVGEFSKARQIYEQVLPVFKEKEITLYYAITLLNYSNALYELFDFKRAEEMVLESLPMLIDFKNMDYIGLAYLHLGKIAYYKQDLNKALKQLDTSLEYSKKGKGDFLVESFLLKLQILIEEKKYRRALEILQDSILEKELSIASLKNRLDFNLKSAEVYAEVGDYRKSVKSWEAAYQVRDSLGKINKSAEAAELAEKYQNDLLENTVVR